MYSAQASPSLRNGDFEKAVRAANLSDMCVAPARAGAEYEGHESLLVTSTGDSGDI